MVQAPGGELRFGEIYQLKYGGQRLIDCLIELTIKHRLLAGWESTDYHDMLHYYFVQEFGREFLV